MNAAHSFEVQWSGPGLVSTPGTINAIVNEAGVYELVVTDLTNGCEANLNVIVFSGEQVHFDAGSLRFPNVITPNGDDNNNYWKPFISGESTVDPTLLFDKWHLMVYNRWGNKIFESESATNFWKAEDESEGTYFYTLEFSSRCGGTGLTKKNGTITVLR
jgi:hypothetical protein